MKLKTFTAATGLMILALVASAAAFAHTKAHLDASADRALEMFYALNPANKHLVDKAAGVLVFSHVAKGGVGVAGEYGQGVLRVKHATVGYYSISAASVGLTLGFAKHSEVILFMTQEALDKFQASKGWSVGADTQIALVSLGAGGEYDSNTVGKPILGFVFGEKGLLGDISFDGSKISDLATTG
jgi:lipid-binding SYLF domain-containing protein